MCALATRALLGCTSEDDTAPTTEASRDGSDAAVNPPDCASAEESSDSRFSALYRDIFSTAGSARCQSGFCHGRSGGLSGLEMKAGASGAYEALTTFKTENGRKLVEVRPGGGDGTAGSALVDELLVRKVMPTVSDTVGNRRPTPKEIDRIRAWISCGAPSD